ncbi:Stf0 family sulfotransferase [Haliea sp. E1-2-M8]|uniref:Stf0 family sulfotransferase n=1 Tax=Haliea sp. E1-2-M8 TaxID=3064706 RepID=UPI002728BF4D|nr:Stf0 family sulfotransferase [Haliea sp. E1-2-M8]MDO8862041.1 Stf0 family sulfotransferase [Haliea sp. E1-2-M8]
MEVQLLKSLSDALYPSQSVHQEKIEGHFGDALLRPLSPPEQHELNSLDLFFVVFTNRSGSTYLTELLHLAGAGIHPRAEQFNESSVLDKVRNESIHTFTDYVLSSVREQQENGRVGFKISAAQLFWLTRLGFLPNFRSVRLIHSLREDRIAQAVSHVKARATGQWHTLMPLKNSQPVPYSRREMLKCLRGISRSQELCNYYSSIHQPPRLDVVYERVLEDPYRELQRMANFLGIAGFRAKRVKLDAVVIQQQRDQENERLSNIFKEEFGFTGSCPVSTEGLSAPANLRSRLAARLRTRGLWQRSR